MLFLGIVRKSPAGSKDKRDVSIEIQKSKIKAQILRDNPSMDEGDILFSVVWAVDVCKGDDEAGRVNFLEAAKHISNYSAAYCLNVDRFSRSWLGVKWLHEYFLDVQLRFVEGLGSLYDDEGHLIEESYLQFFIMCAFAQYELLKIRKRTSAGREKLREDPDLWKSKFKGRPKGAKNKKKARNRS